MLLISSILIKCQDCGFYPLIINETFCSNVLENYGINYLHELSLIFIIDIVFYYGLPEIYLISGDPLYTVKWYRGRSEFFRYLPKELPHTRTFPGAGLSVDERKSGPHQVVLMDLTPAMSGRYRCEVSADAPSFDTAMVGGYLTVVGK